MKKSMLLFKVSFSGSDVDGVTQSVENTYKVSSLEALYNYISKSFTGVAYKSITQLV